MVLGPEIWALTRCALCYWSIVTSWPYQLAKQGIYVCIKGSECTLYIEIVIYNHLYLYQAKHEYKHSSNSNASLHGSFQPPFLDYLSPSTPMVTKLALITCHSLLQLLDSGTPVAESLTDTYAFQIGPFSLSIISLRFIQLALYISGGFHSMAWIYQAFSTIHPLEDICIVSSWTLTNKVVMDIRRQAPMWKQILISLRKLPQIPTTGLYGTSIFSFERNWQTRFQSGSIILRSHQQWVNDPVSLSALSSAADVSTIFHFSHSEILVAVTRRSLNFHFCNVS